MRALFSGLARALPAVPPNARSNLRNNTIGLVNSSMSNQRRIEVSDSASVSVVRFQDQKIIDPEAIQELGQELFDLVEREDRKKLVLNFANVEFLSSAALGKLITFEKKVKRNESQLVLTNISPEIFQVFAITNLDKLFTIKDSEADALAIL